MTTIDRFADLLFWTGLFYTTAWVLRTLIVCKIRKVQLRSQIRPIGIGTLLRFCTLLFAISVVRSDFAATGLTWLVSHRDLALMATIALGCVHAIYRIPAYLSRSPETVPAKLSRFRPTAEDDRTTAAHEAGHVLVFCASRRIPVAVCFFDYGSTDYAAGFLGKLEYLPKRVIKTRQETEWLMLAALAGRAAEQVLTSEMTTGSNKDFELWQYVATTYLTSGFGSNHFFDPPRNSFEAEQNREALDRLRASQIATLQAFFDLNREPLERLAAALLEHRRLTAEDLEPFAAELRTTEGLPPALAQPDGIHGDKLQ